MSIARFIAGAGALAGGYLQGQKMAEDQAYEKEKRQRERDEFARQEAERQVSADTLGRIGQSTAPAISGEDALVAGNQALQNAMSGAQTDEARQVVQKSYEPTITALTAQRGIPAQEAGTYTKEQGQADFLRRMYKIDPMKASQAESTQLQLDKMRKEADTQKRLTDVDNKLRSWGQTNIQKDADGNPQLTNESMVNLTKMRTLLLSQQGLYDHAMQTAKDGMQYAGAKIQADTAARQVAVRDAVAAAGMGDFSKAQQVYKQFVPDGADPVDIQPGKNGTLVMNRKSALDGAPLPPILFKDMDHFMSSLNALSDGNALTSYVDRTFKHDIESRKVAAIEENARAATLGAQAHGASAAASGILASVAQGKETRASTREDAVSKGVADYADAEARGDEKGMSAARRVILTNGGKLDKPEVVKPDVKVGQIGDITVSQPTGKGGVQVTNYGPDMKQKGSVSVPAPGTAQVAPVAAPKSKADFEKLPAGTVYIDPEDGKKYRKP